MRRHFEHTKEPKKGVLVFMPTSLAKRLEVQSTRLGLSRNHLIIRLLEESLAPPKDRDVTPMRGPKTWGV